jgi:hypothetical protein
MTARGINVERSGERRERAEAKTRSHIPTVVFRRELGRSSPSVRNQNSGVMSHILVTGGQDYITTDSNQSCLVVYEKY